MFESSFKRLFEFAPMSAGRTMLPMHRQVLLLASAQAIFQTASVLVTTVGGLAGSTIAPSPLWATAPIATMVLGTALATVPASMWMTRVGRRIGFVVGASFGVVGGLIAAFGVATSSLLLLCLGTLLVGTYQAFAQFYRFAASEVSTSQFQPRAIALVLAGGVVAALAGPALGRFGADLLRPAYTASFLVLAGVSLLGVLISLWINVSNTVTNIGQTTIVRPLRLIVLQPTFLVALFGAATGYGVMILAMTATPLAMAASDHGLPETATVIQLHVLGMFLPSFITGSLIARFGVLRIMLTGVVLLTGHVLLTLSGTGFSSFASALVLLGVGWNFLYIGGTTLLTSTYTAAEKGKAQATNDLTIFLISLASSLTAGFLENSVGWQTMNLMLLPWLALAAAAIAWKALWSKTWAAAPVGQ